MQQIAPMDMPCQDMHLYGQYLETMDVDKLREIQRARATLLDDLEREYDELLETSGMESRIQALEGATQLGLGLLDAEEAAATSHDLLKSIQDDHHRNVPISTYGHRAVLGSNGVHFESDQVIVSGAMHPLDHVNGTYVPMSEFQGRKEYKNQAGAMMYWRDGWKISAKGNHSEVTYTNNNVQSDTPPDGNWRPVADPGHGFGWVTVKQVGIARHPATQWVDWRKSQHPEVVDQMSGETFVQDVLPTHVGRGHNMRTEIVGQAQPPHPYVGAEGAFANSYTLVQNPFPAEGFTEKHEFVRASKPDAPWYRAQPYVEKAIEYEKATTQRMLHSQVGGGMVSGIAPLVPPCMRQGDDYRPLVHPDEKATWGCGDVYVENHRGRQLIQNMGKQMAFWGLQADGRPPAVDLRFLQANGLVAPAEPELPKKHAPRSTEAQIKDLEARGLAVDRLALTRRDARH